MKIIFLKKKLSILGVAPSNKICLFDLSKTFIRWLLSIIKDVNTVTRHLHVLFLIRGVIFFWGSAFWVFLVNVLISFLRPLFYFSEHFKAAHDSTEIVLISCLKFLSLVVLINLFLLKKSVCLDLFLKKSVNLTSKKKVITYFVHFFILCVKNKRIFKRTSLYHDYIYARSVWSWIFPTLTKFDKGMCTLKSEEFKGGKS